MTSRSAVPPNSATAFAAAAQVARAPGLRTEEIAPLLGWTPIHTSKALTGAKHGGLVGYIRNDGVARWYPAAQMPQRLAEMTERKAERIRRQKRAEHARRTARLLDAAADQTSRRLSDTPEVKIAPGNTPLPWECRAVRSVFDLGGRM